MLKISWTEKKWRGSI